VKLPFLTISLFTATKAVIVIIYLIATLALVWWIRTRLASWRSMIIAAYAISVLVLILWWVPKIQVSSLPAKGVKAEDVFKAENDARAILAQIIGGFGVLVGLYFAWQNIASTKDAQVTDRFYKAIEQLGASDDKGKPKFELRQGGIYALERIAHDSERDHWPIMQILTAYVRENSPRNEAHLRQADSRAPLAFDIQAVVRVIRLRKWRYEKPGQYLHLVGADLHGADLRDAHLVWANLSKVDLTQAFLYGANLTEALLAEADLEGASLKDVILGGAFLHGANLVNADLTGVDLRDSRGLTQERINSAIGDTHTKLPAGLVRPESWTKKSS
jgi:hypothetical protein